jgi:predicted transposase YdaD
MTLEMLKKDTYDSGFTAGRNEGISLGAQQKAVETAKSMKLENMSISMISHFTGLTPDEIEKL